MTVKFKVDNLKQMNTRLKAFAEYLRGQGVNEDAVFASRLVSCELITNVIRHGGDEAEFCGSIENDCIRITVSAESLKGVGTKTPPPDPFAEGGRGLYIINSLCYGEMENCDGEIRVLVKI